MVNYLNRKSLVADDTDAYYSKFGAVFKAALDGSQAPEMLFQGMQLVSIDQDETHVYFAVQNAGEYAILRTAK